MLYEIVGNKKYRKYADMALLLIGSFITAVGIAVFLAPNKLAAGGVSGIGIIIYHVTGGRIPIGASMIILNIPLFLISLKKIGVYFIFKTVLGAVYLSAFIDILTHFNRTVLERYFAPETPAIDLLLYAVCGGALSGIGVGLVYLIDGTTGGSDLLARVITLKKRHSSIGRVLLAVDAAIVLAASIVFESFLIGIYAFVAIYISSRTIDSVLEGFHFAKALIIISEKSEEISGYILNKLNRGATGLYGKGMYSGKDMDVLICVVKRRQLPQIKDSIKIIDPKAFVIITDVREVSGEGF